MTLSGAVLPGEADRVVARAKVTRGVTQVDNRLSEVADASRVPGLQGSTTAEADSWH